jgi:hypothetical protein
MKYVVTIPEIVLLVVTIVTLALFFSIYPITVPWKPVFASPDTQTFYPSDYTLLGSTRYVSGSLTNLTSDDSVYMTFRSYVSASNTTAKTNAFIAYRDSTTSLNTSKERTWTGDTASWGSQTEMATSGSPVRFVRVAYSPIQQRSFEKIVVTLSDDGYLDAYVWDGTGWSVTDNIAFTDIGALATKVYGYKCFDIAYTQQWRYQVDIRLRYVTDMDIIPRERCNGHLLEWRVVDEVGRTLRKYRIPEAWRYWKLYETEEDPYTIQGLQFLREQLMTEKDMQRQAYNLEQVSKQIQMLKNTLRLTEKQFATDQKLQGIIQTATPQR